jgi:hypothetical protein
MEIRNSCKPQKHDGRRGCFSSFELRVLPSLQELLKVCGVKIGLPRALRFDFRSSLFVLLCLAGCGAPGEPKPPSPPVPVAVSDLAACQFGDGAQLSFTLPSNTISGDKLAAPPAVEILRGAVKPDGSPDSKSFRVVYTIPGALVEKYRTDGQIRFTDPIAPEETKAHPGAVVVYTVRTRASQKRASADSNFVSLRVFPVPERITSVQTNVTETAVELSWPAPARTSAGDPIAAPSAYRIYRGEIDPRSLETVSKDFSATEWISPLVPLGNSDTNAFRDTQFEFGKTYVYTVRSIIHGDGLEIESDNSVPAALTVRDIFPPAAPQGLVAAVLPGAAPGTVVVDLSWSINLETDLAGYHVYRSEQEGTRGQLLIPDLLPTPSVRDTSVVPGHRYWYTVTAVDRAGNESSPSVPVVVDVTQPST